MDDGDGVVVGDGQDAFAGVGGADAEVVHASGAAEAHFSEWVEVVVAEPVVLRAAVSGRGCFGERGVGGGWGAPIEFSVRPSLVVELAEAVELGLQLASRRGGWLPGEPAFEGLVPALDLALGLRVAGVAVLLGDAEDGE